MWITDRRWAYLRTKVTRTGELLFPVTGQNSQNPEREGAVESHPCAQNAQGWGTRPIC
jgi:hypothetical protein